MLGIGALASLGLALPTGLAFGYGYGYGVRAGYNAYKQPSSEVQKLKLSPNPITGALGAGLQSAEERTGTVVAGIPVTDEPSLAAESAKTVEEPYNPSLHQVADVNKKEIRNKCGKYRMVSSFKSYEEMQEWRNMKCSQRSYSQKGKYRYQY